MRANGLCRRNFLGQIHVPTQWMTRFLTMSDPLLDDGRPAS